MLSVNNENFRTTFSGVFIVNFEHISLISSVSIVDFEQVNVTWAEFFFFHSASKYILSVNNKNVFGNEAPESDICDGTFC